MTTRGTIDPIPQHITARRLAYTLDRSVKWVKERVKVGEFKGCQMGQDIMVEVDSVRRYIDDREIKQPGKQ